MKALRIKLSQSSANYKKEESIENKMTYPLPPISTIIGSIHNACGYTSYHPMDISVQGKFESMHKEPYTDYCFLNSTMDDRGTLVKMDNETLLSKAFEKVAKAKASKGSSFRNRVTIEVYNEDLLKEYQNLKNLKEKIDSFKKERINRVLELIKQRKKTLSEKKKNYDKNSNEFKKIQNREKEIKKIESVIKEKIKEYETQNYTYPISQYRSLTTSLKFYEILDNINLIIHVKTDEVTMNTILDNIYNLKSLGRSEDFVNIEESKIVELVEDDDCDIVSSNSAYLDYEDIKNVSIISRGVTGRSINGTKYYINKNYDTEAAKNGRRVFAKKKVLYASYYQIDSTSENVLIDRDGDTEYIVNFI